MKTRRGAERFDDAIMAALAADWTLLPRDLGIAVQPGFDPQARARESAPRRGRDLRSQLADAQAQLRAFRETHAAPGRDKPISERMAHAIAQQSLLIKTLMLRIAILEDR